MVATHYTKKKKKYEKFRGLFEHEAPLKSASVFVRSSSEWRLFSVIFLRYEISMSTPYDEGHSAPEIVQMNEQSLDDEFSVVLSDARKSSVASFAKDVHTQTENDDRQDQRSKSSNSNLVEGTQKKRKKPFFRCKRPKEPSEANLCERKADSQASKKLPLAGKGEKPTRKPMENPKTKSPSDESVCECRAMSQRGSSELKSERRREMNKKCTARCKMETFGTIPFSQVVRPAIFDSMLYRGKPPACPKRAKNEPGNVSNAASSKKESSTSKKPADGKQSAVHSSRKFKWKSRAEESSVEKEAREMKALKAYNEVTLLKDKKELEARKKPIVGKQLAAVGTPESSKTHSRPYWRKNRPDRCKRNVPRNVDNYLDKENLFVDAITETEPLLNVPTKNSKTFVTTNDGRKTLLPEKYPCSNKLSKVSKIADKLLDNFDRLRGGQAKQGAKRSKRTGEAETKKHHTKYSRPRKLTEEEEENKDGSTVSMRKLEGMQKGRELERTPGKKDVRGPLEIPAASSDVDSRLFVESERDKETLTSANLCVDFSVQAERLLTVVKPTTQDVASSWSSSTIEQENEEYFPEQGRKTISEMINDNF